MNQITLRNVFFFDRQLNFNIMQYIMLKDTHTENTSVCLVLHKSPNNCSGLMVDRLPGMNWPPNRGRRIPLGKDAPAHSNCNSFSCLIHCFMRAVQGVLLYCYRYCFTTTIQNDEGPRVTDHSAGGRRPAGLGRLGTPRLQPFQCLVLLFYNLFQISHKHYHLALDGSDSDSFKGRDTDYIYILLYLKITINSLINAFPIDNYCSCIDSVPLRFKKKKKTYFY